MKVIDLHGMIEEDAVGYVMSELFSLKEGEELEIITGNGIVLKDMTLNLINEEGLRYRHEGHNIGSIIVYK